MAHYQNVQNNVNFADLEQRILAKWKSEGTFQKSIVGEGHFTFYDGPPFANGLPHYGHLLTGYIKDAFARYQTMFGKKVERRFGWDCHGLPAEMGAEKELGISGKLAIEEFGIDKFNQHCQTSVMRYANEWRYYVDRQGRWVDMENDYKTMDINYMESVLWVFKQLYDKGYVYESMRVMPYSWACQTPVSDFETRMDNSYREKVSKAVTVAFTIEPAPLWLKNFGLETYKLVAWTTTPWTLPSNLALAVGEAIDYVLVKQGVEGYIIAKNLLEKYHDILSGEVLAEFSGAHLVGLYYQPLFHYFAKQKGAFKVLSGDFVTTEDGTGIVHIAPGFGEDDHKLCQQHGIDLVCPIDMAGNFTSEVDDFVGMQVFAANDPIIIALKKQGSWLKTEQYLHNYPHCWRTDTPLIYRALPSWYVKVTEFKDRMLKNNQQINWIPHHIKDGMFGKWLENARDWSISRNRYFGCPIPVWRSDDPRYPHTEVYGSTQELQEAFGVEITDLHRPFIDTLTKPNPSDPTGQSKLVRVPDVLDCWFESGAMPYGQIHYPFENQDWFAQNFPADFIVEYVAQTRGWFYTLLVLSTALFDQPPFLNCICHGVLLGTDGQKLSKRLRNYPDPEELFATIGSDALRWFMLSSTVMRGQELVIDKEANMVKEMTRKVLKPLWNAYNFFVLYANADGLTGSIDFTSEHILDRYILAKLALVVNKVKVAIEGYDSITATNNAEEFLEVLNNWYIRRCRERFWKSAKDTDKQHAYNTLYTVLTLFCRTIAPLLPMLTEEIYTALTGEESVHLTLFPDLPYEVDNNLLEQMERVRHACTAALSIRNDMGIRVRQPLQKVVFIGVANNSFNQQMTELILQEANVKQWMNLPKEHIKEFADYRLQIKFPVLGKRLPSAVKDIITAQKAGEWQLVNNELTIAGHLLMPEEFDLLLQAKPEYHGKIASLPTNDALVLLDLNLTPELIMEGTARDIVRTIQQIRKDMNLELTEQINLLISTQDEDVKQAIAEFSIYIKEQTLALHIQEQYDANLPLYDVEGKKLGIKLLLRLNA